MKNREDIAATTIANAIQRDITMADIEEAVRIVDHLPKPPSVIYVRRDFWPKLEKLCRVLFEPIAGTDVVTEPAVSFAGIPIRIVDHLPLPWMTDLDLPEAVTGLPMPWDLDMSEASTRKDGGG